MIRLVGALLAIWLIYALWQAVTGGVLNSAKSALLQGWRETECRINPYECIRR